MNTRTGAECRCLLSDGKIITLTATRRPREQRAEVKTTLHNQPVLSRRIQEVVRLARHTEARHDTRDQVLLSIDPLPTAGQRDWELAAVLVDRMVRGAYCVPADRKVIAQGWSNDWERGQITGALPTAASQAWLARLDEAPCQLIFGGVHDEDQAGLASPPPGRHEILCIRHLGGLNGHPDPAALVSSSRAWFPLHSGGGKDSLAWVEVSVRPVAAGADDEEGSIAVPGADMVLQNKVRQVLAAARQFDPKGEGRWRSVVRFGQPQFQGESYQLALVMADRIARGRDFAARGRLIASACSDAWHTGQVQTVEGQSAKCALILRLAQAGDRVLMPMDWQATLPPDFAARLRAKGATFACIERLGWL